LIQLQTSIRAVVSETELKQAELQQQLKPYSEYYAKIIGLVPPPPPPEPAVEYGNAIRLVHCTTGNALHSHRINYNHSNSSGQQQGNY
jgi:hypothetical protein